MSSVAAKKREAPTANAPMLTTAEFEAAIRAGHPYELPEIIAVPIERGLPAYLDWVAAETIASRV